MVTLLYINEKLAVCSDKCLQLNSTLGVFIFHFHIKYMYRIIVLESFIKALFPIFFGTAMFF